MNDAIPAFLVPTPAGAAFASASYETDARRLVLSGLLRGAASRPVPLARLGELAGMTDRKSVGALLYRMQREGLLSGDVEPLRLPDSPLAETLALLLPELSASGGAVLADRNGFVIATSRVPPETAAQLAACSAGLHPFRRRYGAAFGPDAAPAVMELASPGAGMRWSVRTLYIGRQPFHLTLGADAKLDSDAFVHLVALLSRRYLGEC